MGLSIAELSESHLGGGSLSEIVSALMVPEKIWAKHLAKTTREGKKSTRALSEAIGHAVPAELGEWLDLQGAKGIPETYDSGWYVGCRVTVPKKGQADK